MARARLDVKYVTICRHLSAFVKFEWVYRRIWPSTGAGLSESSSYIAQLRGALQPLADVWKDVKDTVKPYRTKSAILNDFLQPIYGVGNLLKGCIYLAAIVPLFLFLAVYHLIDEGFSKFPDRLASLTVKSFAWFIDGVLSIVRGATQLAATPLTWFIKMPIRSCISMLLDFIHDSSLRVENKETMQWLVSRATHFSKLYAEDWSSNDNGEKSDKLIKKIHKKYQNSTYSSIAPKTEMAIYNSFKNGGKTMDSRTQYLNLFQPSPESTADDDDVRLNYVLA